MGDIIFDCPLCAASLKIDANAVGMHVECPTCGKEIEIPVVASPALPESVPEIEATGNIGSDVQPSDRLGSQVHALPPAQPAPPSPTPAVFRKLLQQASDETVAQIQEASRLTRLLIGD